MSHPRLDEDSSLVDLAVAIDTPATQQGTGLAEALQRYLTYRAMRGSTDQGLLAIRRYGQDFVVWCAERGVSQILQITPQTLLHYQEYLHAYRQRNGQPLLVTSRLAKLVPVRGWMAWLMRKGEITVDPAATMELPKADRTLPRGLLSLADVEKVLGQADLERAIGLRDRALMEVLFSTGIRRMEVAGLDLGDVDLDRHLLQVRRGKGRKDRLLPLGQRAAYWVQRYLSAARNALLKDSDSGRLFVGQGGKPLTLPWLSQIVSAHVKAADLGKRGSCHLLRHAMATLMLEGGADIRYIQEMLGHAQLVTTQIYTHVAIGKLQQVHATTHPAARLSERAQT